MPSPRPLRVLHLHTLPVVSGSGINTLLSMTGLDPARWTTALACAPARPVEGSLEERVRAAGLGYLPIPHFVQKVSPPDDARALLECASTIRAWRPDVVHTHNSKAGFLGRLAARLCGVRAVVHTVHGFAFHDSESPPRRALFRLLERTAAPWADATIVISNPLRAWAIREGIPGAAGYHVIHSGIDLEAFRRPMSPEARAAARRSLGAGADDLLVGLVSKVWEGKGHADLLAAAAALAPHHPRLRLAFVGEGPLRASLEAEAARLGLAGAVRFAGFRDDVPAVTAALDVACLPSRFEGMGRVVLEAMACGVPVVASRVGGIPDLVRDGETGLLVPPGDPAALAAALDRLLADAARRRAMGAAAAARSADPRYDVRMMVRGIERVYEEVLARVP